MAVLIFVAPPVLVQQSLRSTYNGSKYTVYKEDVMATLQLTIGPITAQRDASNAKAQEVLTEFLKRNGYDLSELSQQEQADAVIAELVDYVIQQARMGPRALLEAQHSVQIEEEIAAIDWANGE
jgi:hypothetical protein